jgi:hypothetical protein
LHFLPIFRISRFSKAKKLTTLFNWYHITDILDKFWTLCHALVDPIKLL